MSEEPIKVVVLDSDYATFGFDEHGNLALFDELDHAPVIRVVCAEVDEWEGIYDRLPDVPGAGPLWKKRQ